MSTILYPFTILNKNKESYINTIEFAKEIGAKVVCFTAVIDEEKLDDAYLHLLDLQGYYQTNFNNWKSTEMKVLSELKIGILVNQLSEFIKTEQVDFIIADANSMVLNESFIYQLVKESDNQPTILNL